MNVKLTISSIKWTYEIISNIIRRPDKKDYPIRYQSSWVEEKEDILERAHWACSKVITSPENLLNAMPAVMSEKYAGQCAMYTCSLLAQALANISVLYPETKSKNLASIALLIEQANSGPMRRFDTIHWNEDAIESIKGPNSHLPYLSLLAWMICNYKLCGGDNRYDNIYKNCCESLHRHMLESSYDLNILSYPKMQIFIMDVLVAVLDLHYYSQFFDNRYCDTVQQWILNAKTKWIDQKTGLIHSMLPGEEDRIVTYEPRGCYTAFTCSLLGILDEDFGRKQYELMKKVFLHEVHILGITLKGLKEYINKAPIFRFEQGDAGLVVRGLGTCASAFALGGSTYYEDWGLRSHLLFEASIVSRTCHDKNGRHYRLAEYFIAGEILALSMRTNIKR